MAKHCEDCPFKGYPTIGSRGPKDSPIVIVTDPPSEREILDGKPFAGDSGKLINTMFARAGWPNALETALITNATRCHPPRQEDVSRTALQACKGRLHDEIAEYPRQVVIAMGAIATKAVLNDHRAKITALRGQVFDEAVGVVVPMLHPLSVLRNPNDRDKLQRDIQTAKDVAATGRKTKNPGHTTYRVVQNVDECVNALSIIKTKPYIAADIETLGKNPRRDGIISLAIAHEPNTVTIFPDEFLQPEGLIHQFMQETDTPRWIWQNGKFDVSFFEARGMHVPLNEDTEVMHYTLSPVQGTHGLKEMSREYLGATAYNDQVSEIFKSLEAKAKKEKWGREANYGDIPLDVLYPYQAQDADYTLQLFNIFNPLVQQNPKKKFLYTRLLMPSSRFLRIVERDGMYVSQERLELFRQHHIREREFAVSALNAIVEQHWDGEAYELQAHPDLYKSKQNKKGEWVTKQPKSVAFNHQSNNHLRYILYKHFKLEVLKRQLIKKGQVTANKETLDYLLSDPMVKLKFGTTHIPFLKAMMTVKSITKQIQSCTTLLNAIDLDNRIHSTFNTTRVDTGRLSSSDPNLQNVDKKKRSIIRRAFIAPDGHLYIEGDLSQAELRILAFLSQDAWFLQVFEDDKDLHNEMSILLFGAAENFDEKTWDEFRRISKTVNFGIPYGRTSFGITRALDFLTVERAAAIIRDWFERCPQAGAFLLSEREKAASGSTLITPFGRERKWRVITNENREKVKREGSNHKIQSTASDVNLVAAMESYPAIKKLGGKFVNLVHDSQMVQAHNDWQNALRIARVMHSNMVTAAQRWIGCNVPFKADVKIGYSWEDMKKVSYEEMYSERAA